MPRLLPTVPVLPLLAALILGGSGVILSGCQFLLPQNVDRHHEPPDSAPVDNLGALPEPMNAESSSATLPEMLHWRAGTTPNLNDWMNFQLYVSGLSRADLEKLWSNLQDTPGGADNHQLQLQLAVVALQYPARRNFKQINDWLEQARVDLTLDNDTRLFAQWLQPWCAQVQRSDAELARLRQQLDSETQSKQELEEKIRKLSDIEETLNQRQRDREP